MSFRVFETEFAGRTLTVEIGKMALLTNGSALIKYGETSVLATVCAAKKAKEGQDFFPLTIDYEEKMYAAGKIPGGFIKREARPSEKAILACRLIDRPLRPLFPKGYYNNVQLVTAVMSADYDHAAEIVAMVGSSIVLSVSDIPFQGPTGSVLVGLVDGEFVANPTLAQREVSDLHLIVSGTKEAIMMVEAGSNEISEEIMLDAIMFAHEEIKKVVAFIEKIVAEVGVAKSQPELLLVDADFEKEVTDFVYDLMKVAVFTEDKTERLANMAKVEEDTIDFFTEKDPDCKKDVSSVLYSVKKEIVRGMIVDEGIRPDNRSTEEIRPISCEVDLLPRVHGSGLFTRGDTQALTVTTLGALGEKQRIDGLSEETEKRYIHHYNFPPYSVGEAGFMRGPGRREIGHGALAERALLPVLPNEEDFPYAIRLVSEVLSSNGSSSQASVCGSTLSLMAAGVPIKAPVAGIAMGLIQQNDKIAILSDIQGMEDYLGDMDFKVAGTEKGITAIQMDIKVDGLSREILKNALTQANAGRMHILGKMESAITAPKEEVSAYAPRVFKHKIKPDKIRDVIGPGGKIINGLIAEFDVKIDISDEGLILVTAKDKVSGENAIVAIKGITAEAEVGKIYKGKVVRITTFGAFVQILPGKDGLLHISKIAHEKVAKVEDVLTLGEELDVKVVEIDGQGRINLSRKALLDSSAGKTDK